MSDRWFLVALVLAQVLKFVWLHRRDKEDRAEAEKPATSEPGG